MNFLGTTNVVPVCGCSVYRFTEISSPTGYKQVHHPRRNSPYDIPVHPHSSCQPPIYLLFSSVSFRMSCKDTCGPWPDMDFKQTCALCSAQKTNWDHDISWEVQTFLGHLFLPVLSVLWGKLFTHHMCECWDLANQKEPCQSMKSRYLKLLLQFQP